MNPRIPLLLLTAFLLLATAGCIQPPAEPNPANETGYNISAVERDPVREAAAEKILGQYEPEYIAYQNQTGNKDYFGYLISVYPREYQHYQTIGQNMSFIAYLERYYTPYPLSLDNNYNFTPFRLSKAEEPYQNLPVISLTDEDIRNSPILRSYCIDVPGFPLKVLRSEEEQLNPYWDTSSSIRKAYLAWNNTYYWMNRAIA